MTAKWQYRSAYEAAVESLINLRDENAKLRVLVDGLTYCANESCGMCCMRSFGESEPFTCCPVYDYRTGERGCKTLKRELGIGVGEDD